MKNKDRKVGERKDHGETNKMDGKTILLNER
jgi:hypothetical protein